MREICRNLTPLRILMTATWFFLAMSLFLSPLVFITFSYSSYSIGLPGSYSHSSRFSNFSSINLLHKKSFCAKFPQLHEIEYSNLYWQTLRASIVTAFFYGAYYDIRELNHLAPCIRILGMMKTTQLNPTMHCQLWFKDEVEPLISPIIDYKRIWYSKWSGGDFMPYLLACRVPKSHLKKVPNSVSIVEKKCDPATNNLRIIFEKPEVKEDFAVCVKGLDFLNEDISFRLVEWIELLGILGAQKIVFYKFAVHPNVSKVLQFYSKTGGVEVIPLTLPGGSPNEPKLRHEFLKKRITEKRLNELIPYNDCLYRNLYSFKYIALLDIDEVIMPMKTSRWEELMKEVSELSRVASNRSRSSYHFRNVYFMDGMLQKEFPDVPKYLHMLQHVFRSTNYTKPNHYVKSFHNPERVLTLHNHMALSCIDGSCNSYPVEKEVAHLQHYRDNCVGGIRNCTEDFKANITLDNNIWRFKETLVFRANDVLKRLGLV